MTTSPDTITDNPDAKVDCSAQLADKLLARIEDAPVDLGIPHSAIDSVLIKDLGIAKGCDATRDEIIAALSIGDEAAVEALRQRTQSLLFQLRPDLFCKDPST